MTKHDFSNYLSPFSWRYGSKEMRAIFSEQHKYQLWRKIWVALAKAQYNTGLVTKVELDDLKRHQNDIDIEEILRIEKETKHDVVAAVKEFASKAKIGGGKIHLGATSMDIVDNADALRVQEALRVILKRLTTLLELFADEIELYADTTCMAYTHLQPAEPTTIGYRLSFYAQDLFIDLQTLEFIERMYRAKGFKGAVGTAASYSSILKKSPKTPQDLENIIMGELGLRSSLITTQVNSRKFDVLVMQLLASIAQSLYKFASDIRILQSPAFGEWSEPFAKTQVGSSAMPFKRNPKISENICSLARFVMLLPTVALENAAHSYLERTLDDSGNRRSTIPESFLATEEILLRAQDVISGLRIDDMRIIYNLEQYAPFAATESILIELVRKGANRQEMHELLRSIALEAWEGVQYGFKNPLPDLLKENKTIQKYLDHKTIDALLDVSHHTGDAPKRAKKLVKDIRKQLNGYI